MRHGNPCPKCGSKNQISQLQQPNLTDPKSVSPSPVVSAQTADMRKTGICRKE